MSKEILDDAILTLMGMPKFTDRRQAGSRLAREVVALSVQDPVVLGLPRGGVPVAIEVAQALHCAVDVIVVRKLGVPGNQELGFGAVAEDGVIVLNEEVMAAEGIDAPTVRDVAAKERIMLEQRLLAIRAVHLPVAVGGKTAVIVDDGLATGIDATAACRVARGRGAARVIVAVPVAPAGWRDDMRVEADDFVAVIESPHFAGVGEFYEDFSSVPDDEVLRLLRDPN